MNITISYDDLVALVETALQLGISSPELIPDKKGREKMAKWMVNNTINDIKKKTYPEGHPTG